MRLEHVGIWEEEALWVEEGARMGQLGWRGGCPNGAGEDEVGNL